MSFITFALPVLSLILLGGTEVSVVLSCLFRLAVKLLFLSWFFGLERAK